MKKVIYVILVLSLILPNCGKKIDLEYQIQQWIKAHNEHNVTKELTYYPDDAIIKFASDTIKGAYALRNLFEYDSVMHDELFAKDIIIKGDTAIVNSFIERWDFGDSAGINKLHYLPGLKIIFRKGLLQITEVPQFVKEDQNALDQLISNMTKWLQDKYPDKIQEFIESNKLTGHSTETGLMHMKYVQEYQASKSTK